jgi:hypothetical protein
MGAVDTAWGAAAATCRCTSSSAWISARVLPPAPVAVLPAHGAGVEAGTAGDDTLCDETFWSDFCLKEK